LSNLVNDWLTKHADNPAVVWQWRDGSITFGHASRQIKCLAGAFHDQGVRARDRVLTSMQDGPDIGVTLLALWVLGAVPVIISPMLPVDEIVKDAQRASCVWAAVDFDTQIPILRLDHKVPQCPSNDPVLSTAAPVYMYNSHDEFLIQGTSGTSGRNKLAVHGYDGLCGMEQGWRYLELGPGARLYSSMRMTFGFGLQMSVICPWIFGSTHVIDRGAMSIKAVPDIVDQQGITHLLLLPNILKALLRHDRKFGANLHWFGVGSEPMDLTTSQLCEQKLGRRVKNQYGCSEHMGVLLSMMIQHGVPHR